MHSLKTCADDFETPNSGASWRNVKFVRQYAVNQQHTVWERQAPRPAPPCVLRTFTAQRGYQLPETAVAQPSDRGYPRRLRRRDHTSHAKIISP